MDHTKNSLAKNILIALGITGVISVALVAPGVAKLLPYVQKISISRVNQEMNRLRKRGLVEVIKLTDGVSEIKLTSKGFDKLKSFQIDSLQIKQEEKWDRKWRVVSFDVPIRQNIYRDKFRTGMKKLGLYQLQQSVFVHPYPCFEEILFLKEFYNLKEGVEYMEVSNLESQNKLIEHFFT